MKKNRNQSSETYRIMYVYWNDLKIYFSFFSITRADLLKILVGFEPHISLLPYNLHAAAQHYSDAAAVNFRGSYWCR